ncbi:hypothetical protein ACR8AL_07460 [Clavibacter sepedonicus]|uniref:Uncharacterized protein n=1 Tax=Clavibacter sepedonicus TaxID=31964 RepID=B0RJF3_CLASE|nr:MULTISPECIES: hypothetical protein [Clavibacter]MBD5382468.1 hypothetical protein [Clavibacter sp.]OQJ45285.1 hypothetical protein B5P19_15605 [Clavibacter sepedonicus]OQJ50972.1 hypothetical protein B5P20_16240 [Clavibacter sepedonicus]UUK67220.1 hypothetical protein LRE50_15795 [Clavibacter sepedonicus]CAQ03343.1 hypothetical protein pCSL0100 [Clavibacter sepedonicus]
MSDIDYRPHGWTPKDVPTIWVDHTTGQGVTSDGTSVKPKIGQRRKNPNLTDLLDTAASYGATRIMLSGRVPEPAPGVRHWLYVQTPGWTPGTHWIGAGVPPTGRFQHATTGHKVEVRTVAEWFGDLPLTPAQARLTWDTLAAVIASVDERARLMLSPAATGTNLWAWSLPKNVNPVPISEEIDEEQHRTSGQHHYEHLVAGPSFEEHEDCVPMIDPVKTRKISTFAHVDGRFMYAALCRELGIGPAVRLNRSAAYELMTTNPYARARYHVRFTVPADWRHVGILGMRHFRVEDGWYYPNRPGATGETWADAAEISVALNAGWLIDPLEAIVFQKAKPLDTFAERMIRARDRVTQNPEIPVPMQRALSTALRSIMIYTIGALASSGREQTRVVTNPMEIPPEFQRSVQRHGELYIFRVPSTINTRTQRMYHPELAWQIWGRGRARVLDAPTAFGNHTGGALKLAPHTLIGINGDALYTTHVPQWSLPQEHDGGDDGKTGRLRLVSVIEGSFNTPATLDARTALRARADRVGPAGAWAPRVSEAD